jgi:SAM-dependent methyltransferase
MNDVIKLNLGSGPLNVPGYINVDRCDPRADIKKDVFELDYPENSVDEILASHLFEHINPYRSIELLEKWFKMLKPQGKLIMELPNIEELCKLFVTAEKGQRYDILNCIYGALNTVEGTIGEITSSHLWGWYPSMMWDHLSSVGYVNITFGPEQIPHMMSSCNFRVEAQKP